MQRYFTVILGKLYILDMLGFKLTLHIMFLSILTLTLLLHFKYNCRIVLGHKSKTERKLDGLFSPLFLLFDNQKFWKGISPVLCDLFFDTMLTDIALEIYSQNLWTSSDWSQMVQTKPTILLSIIYSKQNPWWCFLKSMLTAQYNYIQKQHKNEN